MKIQFRLILSLLGLLLTSLACNLQSTANSTPNSASQVATLNALLYSTSALQTISAVGLTSTPIQTPVQTSTDVPSPTNPVLTFTPIYTPTSTILCDAASFIKDVTIPDGMVLGRGTNFTKTWRIQNVGSCTWTSSYSVVFINGNGLSASTTNPLTGYIAPGNYVDLSVNMVTPNTDGHYRGFWELLNSSGALFGIGPQANNPFWVDINVSGPSYTAYDFALNFCNATWQNNDGNLPCPGTAGDPRGYVLNLANPVMGGGKAENEPGLLTVPKNSYNGLVRGIYPATQIQSGDHFRALIGCQYKANGCNVMFKLNYQLGNSASTLGQWPEKYDGRYYPVDIDLSPLNGQNVTFQLIVSANGSGYQDQALWINPHIVRPGIPPLPTSTNTPTSTLTSTATNTSTATPTATSTPTP